MPLWPGKGMKPPNAPSHNARGPIVATRPWPSFHPAIRASRMQTGRHAVWACSMQPMQPAPCSPSACSSMQLHAAHAPCSLLHAAPALSRRRRGCPPSLPVDSPVDEWKQTEARRERSCFPSHQVPLETPRSRRGCRARAPPSGPGKSSAPFPSTSEGRPAGKDEASSKGGRVAAGAAGASGPWLHACRSWGR